MVIDNSQANQFRTCPLLWRETNIANGTGLELKPDLGKVAPMDLGSRVHELLEEYYNDLRGQPIPPYPESPNPALETEAQIIMGAYRARYPQEEFEIVDVERTFKVALPKIFTNFYDHIYTGKIDLVFRQNGILNIMDHKTQNRRAASNHPKKWAARDQASLYLWAASKIYNEPIGNFYVNILVRPSEKLQEGPIFPERMKLERTSEQLDIAVRDLVFIADEIERYKNIFGDSLWPSNREACTEGTWGDCPFYLPHTFGWSEAILQEKYQPKQEYLKLAGVPIIQP